jgi:hypothetical protein
MLQIIGPGKLPEASGASTDQECLGLVFVNIETEKLANQSNKCVCVLYVP